MCQKLTQGRQLVMGNHGGRQQDDAHLLMDPLLHCLVPFAVRLPRIDWEVLTERNVVDALLAVWGLRRQELREVACPGQVELEDCGHALAPFLQPYRPSAALVQAAEVVVQVLPAVSMRQEMLPILPAVAVAEAAAAGTGKEGRGGTSLGGGQGTPTRTSTLHTHAAPSYT